MNKRSIIIMMVVPAVISLLLGLALIIIPYVKIEGDQSGLGYGTNLLLIGALFFISVIVTLVFLLTGLSKLRKLGGK